MQIFRFEWKRSQKYILIWATALAVCIFFMTPVYYGMVETAGTLPAGFAQGGFFETVGISIELLTKPMGMYSFLTGFFMIAGGIFGMHLGLSLHTKECTENTAEYLYTKPCGRKVIYKEKLLCALAGVCVTGIFYVMASFFTMTLFRPGFSTGEFLLVAGSFVLLTLFFALMGTMAGVFRPNNQNCRYSGYWLFISVFLFQPGGDPQLRGLFVGLYDLVSASAVWVCAAGILENLEAGCCVGCVKEETNEGVSEKRAALNKKTTADLDGNCLDFVWLRLL